MFKNTREKEYRTILVYWWGQGGVVLEHVVIRRERMACHNSFKVMLCLPSLRMVAKPLEGSEGVSDK